MGAHFAFSRRSTPSEQEPTDYVDRQFAIVTVTKHQQGILFLCFCSTIFLFPAKKRSSITPFTRGVSGNPETPLLAKWALTAAIGIDDARLRALVAEALVRTVIYATSFYEAQRYKHVSVAITSVMCFYTHLPPTFLVPSATKKLSHCIPCPCHTIAATSGPGPEVHTPGKRKARH